MPTGNKGGVYYTTYGGYEVYRNYAGAQDLEENAYYYINEYDFVFWNPGGLANLEAYIDAHPITTPPPPFVGPPAPVDTYVETDWTVPIYRLGTGNYHAMVNGVEVSDPTIQVVRAAIEAWKNPSGAPPPTTIGGGGGGTTIGPGQGFGGGGAGANPPPTPQQTADTPQLWLVSFGIAYFILKNGSQILSAGGTAITALIGLILA